MEVSCPSTRSPWMRRRKARTAPPPRQQSIATLTIHFTTISTSVASTIVAKLDTGFLAAFTFAAPQRCPSESWAKTDAGVRARVRGGCGAQWCRTLLTGTQAPPSGLNTPLPPRFPRSGGTFAGALSELLLY